MTLVVRRCFSVRLGSRSVAMFDQALERCLDEGVERSQRWTGSAKVGMAPRCLSLGDFVAEVCAEDFQRRVIPPLWRDLLRRRATMRRLNHDQRQLFYSFSLDEVGSRG